MQEIIQTHGFPKHGCRSGQSKTVEPDRQAKSIFHCVKQVVGFDFCLFPVNSLLRIFNSWMTRSYFHINTQVSGLKANNKIPIERHQVRGLKSPAGCIDGVLILSWYNSGLTL